MGLAAISVPGLFEQTFIPNPKEEPPYGPSGLRDVLKMLMGAVLGVIGIL